MMAKSKDRAGLSFEKKNQDLLRIPKSSNAPKIVYVSTKTPFMSAVKRVQKLLKHAEARATAKIELTSKVGEREIARQLTTASKSLASEAVYVKATGRAIDKVVNIGKWFEERNEYTVDRATGTVLVVDDIVEDDLATAKEPDKSDRPSKPAKKHRKMAVDEDGELLESRTRYINTIELTITMK